MNNKYIKTLLAAVVAYCRLWTRLLQEIPGQGAAIHRRWSGSFQELYQFPGFYGRALSLHTRFFECLLDQFLELG